MSVSLADFKNIVFVEILPSCCRGPLAIHDSISITCHGYHYGDIKWFKIDSSSKVPSEINDTDSRLNVTKGWTRHGNWEVNAVLTLHDVTKNDAAAYVCRKSNGYNATKNDTVFIDVAGMSTFLCVSLCKSRLLTFSNAKMTTSLLNCDF